MPFGSLWLPVVVSAVAVWILSAVLYMVLRYHKTDYKPLGDEESVAQALGKSVRGPGVYFLPYCAEMSQMKDPAIRKRFEDGPVAILTVLRNGPPTMGKHLLQWFLFCFLVSYTAAYIARHTLTFGAPGMDAMRITGTVSLVAYGYGHFQDSIWKGIPWSNSLRGLLDAVFYAVATGLVFRFLWPA